MGCHGAFNALRLPCLRPRPRGGVPLVVCVELCSLHFQYGSRIHLIVSNSIFADGAAAVVGTAPPPPHRSGGRSPQVVDVLPDTAAAMGWTIGDHGFEMQLAATVPATVARHLPGIVDRALAEAGLGRSDVAWAVHPGGPRVLAGVAEALDLTGRRTGRVVGRARGSWQHVERHDPIHSRAADPRREPRAVPGVGVRPGPHGRTRPVCPGFGLSDRIGRPRPAFDDRPRQAAGFTVTRISMYSARMPWWRSSMWSVWVKRPEARWIRSQMS